MIIPHFRSRRHLPSLLRLLLFKVRRLFFLPSLQLLHKLVAIVAWSVDRIGRCCTRFDVGRCGLLLELALQVLRLLRCRRFRLVGDGGPGGRWCRALDRGFVGRPRRRLMLVLFGSRRRSRPMARSIRRTRPILLRHRSGRPCAFRIRLSRKAPPILGTIIASWHHGRVCEKSFKRMDP